MIDPSPPGKPPFPPLTLLDWLCFAAILASAGSAVIMAWILYGSLCR